VHENLSPKGTVGVILSHLSEWHVAGYPFNLCLMIDKKEIFRFLSEIIIRALGSREL